MENIDLTILASTCSFFAIFIATLAVINFIKYTSEQYKSKYVEETTTELDDILLQLPPEKIFDLSLAISVFCSLSVAFIVGISGDSFSWIKLIALSTLVAVITFPIPRFYLRIKKVRRLNKFNEQLEDALISISSALKAGFSINQALEVVVKENRNPISVEFKLLMQEVRLGVPLDIALQNMVDRLNSNDFELVATAIITARQTGGELTVTLERLAAMIRERMRINGKLKALTAQGKLQAYVVGAVPFLLMFLMSYVAPNMMSVFFDNIVGIIVIILAVIWIIIGFFIIRKITTIDI